MDIEPDGDGEDVTAIARAFLPDEWRPIATCPQSGWITVRNSPGDEFTFCRDPGVNDFVESDYSQWRPARQNDVDASHPWR